MASKLDIEKLTHDLGLKGFKFVLSEPSEGITTLYHTPDGWADAETTYTRHKTYRSVMRNTSTNELTFYKEGRKFLKNCYENSGIDCNATMTVYRLDKNTNTYLTYPAANKFDFSTYQVDEVSVKIQMIDTSFKEKAINRATTEVDLLKRVSIGSEQLPLDSFTVSQVTMPDTSIDNEDTATVSGSSVGATGEYIVPISGVTTTDFSEMKVPTGAINTVLGGFFQSAITPRTLSVNFDINIDLYRGSGGSVEYTLVHINSSATVQNIYTLYLGTLADFGTDTFDETQIVTLDIGDCLLFQVEFTGTSILTDGLITVTETYTGNPETDIESFPYYEALLRNCQLICDAENPFKSEFFGRTDTPLTTYANDGEIGFVTKGLFFRNYTNSSYTIPVKLKDLFDSLSGIFRLGLGFETILSVDKIVIEDLDYFFPASIILDISDRLREENIEKHVVGDMFYKSMDFGYSKFSYENNAGLFEFNTKNTWTSVIKSVFNDLKKMVKYRADGQGMRLIMLAPEADDYDPTKDVKGDSDIFLIDALRDGPNFVARTDEGFSSIDGSVYAYSSFNLNYSPARNLLRWGAEIKAGLMHALNTYLRWQASEKNTTLSTQLTTESSAVVENEDILVNDLTANRWYNEKYIVKAPITVAELKDIDADPNSLVKLSDTKYGWILSMKTTNKDGMAEMELLRCNLNEVTPIDIIGEEGGNIRATENDDIRTTQ